MRPGLSFNVSPFTSSPPCQDSFSLSEDGLGLMPSESVASFLLDSGPPKNETSGVGHAPTTEDAAAVAVILPEDTL